MVQACLQNMAPGDHPSSCAKHEMEIEPLHCGCMEDHESVRFDKYTHWVHNMLEVIDMTIHEMRIAFGDTQSEFAARYNIPFRTIQNWESGVRKPPEYVKELLESRIQSDLCNRKTRVLPKHDEHKKELPKRSDYIGAASWLRVVRNSLGGSFVFALDEALMCQGNFGGRSDEYVVWGYGDDSASDFNGVVLLGNYISSYDVREKHGLCFTDFNRTVTDALANEAILDMQGITEALSRYYSTNGNSFNGIFVPPEYQERFAALADDAINYYEN